MCIHVYLDAVDMQSAVVFIANEGNEGSDESAHLCSLARVFAMLTFII